MVAGPPNKPWLLGSLREGDARLGVLLFLLIVLGRCARHAKYRWLIAICVTLGCVDSIVDVIGYAALLREVR